MQRAELGMTLDAFIGRMCDERGGDEAAAMVRVFAALQTASKKIAAAAARAALTGITGLEGEERGRADGTDAKKKLDVVANEIVKAELAASRQVAVMASEEDELPIATGSGSLAVVFDPLDGSRNIDVSIPTGTIFGIYSAAGAASDQEAALRPGRELLAAGYALYSSATVMAVSLGGGSGTHGFTLDPLTGSYLLTHHGIRIPDRGQIYSLNDARFHDWPDGLQRYIDAVRQGKGESGKQYSARYVCSLVADFHRTLLYGGWCGNPRSHLRLVYEANPLSLLVEEAGGTGSDGQTRVLDLQPEKLHHRLPLFLGSPSDVKELLSYGNVQQTGAKKYTV